MRPHSTFALAFMLANLACDPSPAKPTTVSAAAGSASGSNAQPPVDTPVPARTPAPASVPHVEVRNGAKPGSVEIIAHDAISLDAKLIVERATSTGGFEPVPLDLGSMRLVESCSDKIGTCVALDAGRILKPVPWSGMSCSSQCNRTCDKNVYRAGRHRFVVVSCDGKQRFEGPVFEMPAM